METSSNISKWRCVNHILRNKTQILFVRTMSLLGMNRPIPSKSTNFSLKYMIQRAQFKTLTGPSQTLPCCSLLNLPISCSTLGSCTPPPGSRAWTHQPCLRVFFHCVLCAALTSLPSFSGATLIKSSMLNPGNNIKINVKVSEKTNQHL